MFKANSTRHIILLALLAFFSLSESLPLAHHHEHEGHPCLQLNGDYFYIETSDHDESDHHTPSITGIELGESHDHLECALCQLASHSLSQDILPSQFSKLVLSNVGHPSALKQSSLADLHRPRGPPIA